MTTPPLEELPLFANPGRPKCPGCGLVPRDTDTVSITPEGYWHEGCQTMANRAQNKLLAEQCAKLDHIFDEIETIAREGRQQQGAHHKRWYANQIAGMLANPVVIIGPAIAP